MIKNNGVPGWFVGGFLDDSLSDAHLKRIEAVLANPTFKIDSAGFIGWLRRELANYRNQKEMNDNLPGIGSDLDKAQRLEASIYTLLRDLESISPDLATQLDLELIQLGVDEVEVARQMPSVTAGLTAMRFALLRVASLPRPGKGRKKSTIRDSFLNRVKDQLLIAGVPKVDVPATAAEIVIACGVNVPQDGRTRPERRRGNN